MQKDILFYSNFCEFSKEVLGILIKNSLKEAFMLVNVDNRQLQLPAFVDRVPLIYAANKKVFSDEHLMAFLQSKIGSSSLQPYSLMGTNTNAYSENFSFIESGDTLDALPEDCSRNYNYLGMDQKIYAPKEDEDDVKSSQSGMLEKFMEDRQMDIAKLFPSNGGFNRAL
jgi:hypothetical protein